ERVFRLRGNLRAVYNSFWLSSTVTLLALAIGVPLGWLLTRTDLPYKGGFLILSTTPYFIPPFVKAISWIQTFGPVGFFNRLLMYMTGSSEPLVNIYSEWGVAFVLTVHFYPVVLMTVAAALVSIDSSFEESARLAGASNFTIARRITLPLIAPAVAASSLLVFLLTIEDVGVTAFIGSRVNFFVMPTLVYRLINTPDIPGAIVVSVWLVLVALVMIVLHRRILGRERRFTIFSGKAHRPGLILLRAWKRPMLIVVIVFTTLLVIVPTSSLFLAAFMKYIGAPLSWKSLTTANFQYILFEYPETQRALVNSFLLGVVGSSIALLTALVVSYANVRLHLKVASVIEMLGSLPIAIPGIVLGVAMILTWSREPFNIYGSLWILLVGYLARYLPFGLQSTKASLQQVDPSLEEAGRVSGAGWVTIMRRILVPILKSGLFAGWLLMFMLMFRDLTLSIMLSSSGTETIGAAVFDLQEGGYWELSAALASLVFIVTMTGIYLLRRVTGREGGLWVD